MAAIFVLLLLVCYWKPIALTLSALAEEAVEYILESAGRKM